MSIKLLNPKELSLNKKVFEREYNEALVHQVTTSFLANNRTSNSKQKTRAEVNHSTKKPWRQKGTGRARAGMTSSPIWRGGGRAFPNLPTQNYTQKVNRKMYKASIQVILSELLRSQRLLVADSFAVNGPKTKDLFSKLKEAKLEDTILLIVTENLDDNLYLASRNLKNTYIVEPKQVNPYLLLRAHKTLFTKEAIKQIEESLA